MKYPILLLAVLTLACQRFDYYGEAFSTNQVESAESVLAALASGEDSVVTTFRAEVAGVCQKKGCWMELDMGNEQTALVRFKDYGFFVPFDAAGEEAIVRGVVKVDTLSVEWLKHQAFDAGKSDSIIALITEPEVSISVIATGVALPEVEVFEEEIREEAEEVSAASPVEAV